jgi:ribonuclease HI
MPIKTIKMLFTRSYIKGLSQVVTQRPVEVYAAGSCYNKATPVVSGGYALYFPGAEHPSVCEPVSTGLITNHRSELLAVKDALMIYKYNMKGTPCTIYTDSIYVVNSLYDYSPIWRKNGWKKTTGAPVKNQDLMKPLCELFETHRGYVSIKHTTTSVYNQERHLRNNSVANIMAKSARMLGRSMTRTL